MKKTEVSVIIPAFNEAETIGEVVKTNKELYSDYEIIVIDDGSTDETALTAKEAGAIVYRHPYNIGTGAAIKRGIRIASGHILVFMNGDGRHDPRDIAELVAQFPDFDMAIGARPKGYFHSPFRAFGNWIFKKLGKYIAKHKIEDLTSGFRAIKADIAGSLLYLIPNTYSFTTTLTLCTLRSGRSLKYVPIKTRETYVKKQKKIRLFRDGLRFVLVISKICMLYSPMRIFIPVSLLTFILGLANYVYTYISNGRFTNMSALLFTASVIIFMIGLVSEQICQMRFERSEGMKSI